MPSPGVARVTTGEGPLAARGPPNGAHRSEKDPPGFSRAVVNSGHVRRAP